MAGPGSAVGAAVDPVIIIVVTYDYRCHAVHTTITINKPLPDASWGALSTKCSTLPSSTPADTHNTHNYIIITHTINTHTIGRFGSNNCSGGGNTFRNDRLGSTEYYTLTTVRLQQFVVLDDLPLKYQPLLLQGDILGQPNKPPV